MSVPSVEMGAAERKALGARLATDYERVMLRDRAKYDASRAELEAKIRAAEDARELLDSARAVAVSDYALERDAITDRLWRERLPLVDELLARIDGEARDLRPETHTRLPQPNPADNALLNWPGRTGALVREGEADPELVPRVTTNGPHVEARRRALHALAEELREATSRGRYATEAELRALFDREYRRLPAVPSLRELERAS